MEGMNFPIQVEEHKCIFIVFIHITLAVPVSGTRVFVGRGEEERRGGGELVLLTLRLFVLRCAAACVLRVSKRGLQGDSAGLTPGLG